MIRSKSVSICNCSYAKLANSGKMTISYVVLERNLLTQRHEFCSQETRALSYHTAKTRSLYLTWA